MNRWAGLWIRERESSRVARELARGSAALDREQARGLHEKAPWSTWRSTSRDHRCDSNQHQRRWFRHQRSQLHRLAHPKTEVRPQRREILRVNISVVVEITLIPALPTSAKVARQGIEVQRV